MSLTGFFDDPCQPRALNKGNWDNAHWKAGPATHHQTSRCEEGRCRLPLRVEKLSNVGAAHYTDRGLRSEVYRLLRLPLLIGLPSGPVFRVYTAAISDIFEDSGLGSQVTPKSEAPATNEAAEGATRWRSRIPSWTPGKMAPRASLRQPSAPSFYGCAFCRTNGERRSFYMSHNLREDSCPGSTGRVTCPVLRKYQCPQCGYPGGDEAHTLRYCPLNRDFVPASVYKTQRKSNGQLRRRSRGAKPRRRASDGTPEASVSGRRVDLYEP